MSLRLALTFVMTVAAWMVGTAAASAATPPSPAASPVELGVALSWDAAPAGVVVERRVEGVGAWSAVSGVIRRLRWVDDTVRPDVEYEYRLKDPSSEQRSGVVSGAPLEIAETGTAFARVSRVQSATLDAPCQYDYRLCPPSEATSARDLLRSAGGPVIYARDRGAVVSSPAGTFRLNDVATRACDAGGVTGGASLAGPYREDNDGVTEVELPMIADDTGALTQAGTDLRARFGGPLTLIYTATLSSGGTESFPDLWFTATTPSGDTVQSMFIRSNINNDDETYEQSNFGNDTTVSYSFEVQFGWLPAGSRILTHARFQAGAPDGQGRPLVSTVSGVAIRAARPAACSPALSPDGHRALVVGDGSINEVDVDNGSVRTVCTACGSGNRQPEHPVYDADGRSVLFAEDGEIYRTSPGGSTAIAFSLPAGEQATDPVLLADGSIGVVGESGAWTVSPTGTATRRAMNAGLVGIDGAGRLLVAHGHPGRVPNGEDGTLQEPGAVFYDLERNRRVSDRGGTQLFAGPAAGGARTRVTSLDVPVDVLALDQAISSSGALLSTLPTLSGPRGLYAASGDTTFYPTLTSETPMRPELPEVRAPEVSAGIEPLAVEVTGGSPRGIVASRFVLAGGGTERAATCGSGCAGGRVRESASLDISALPEGTYRLAGALRELGGGASFATTTTKIDRTPPVSEQEPLVLADGDRDLLAWPGLTDPDLSDGSAGSGRLRLSARRLDADGNPSGVWQEPTSDVTKLTAGPGGAEVRGYDAAGNATEPRKAVRAATPLFDPKLCKRDGRDPSSVWLGISVANPSNAANPDTPAGQSFERTWDCFSRLLKSGRPWVRHQVPLDVMRDKDQLDRFKAFLTILNDKQAPGVLSFRGHGYPTCDGKNGHPLIKTVSKPGGESTVKGAGPMLKPCELPSPKLYRELVKEVKDYVNQEAKGRVQRWTPWNEPDLKPFQIGWVAKGKTATFDPIRGSKRAGEYHKEALRVLDDRQVLAGEFAAMGTTSELRANIAAFKSTVGKAPTRWALHPYKDIVDPGASGTGFTTTLLGSAKASELFLTEAGALLSVGLTKDGKNALPRRLAGKPDLQRQAGEAFRKSGWGKNAVAPFRGIPGSTRLVMFYYQMAGRPPHEVRQDPFDSGIADYEGVSRAVLCGIALKPATSCAGRSKSSADYQ